MLVFALTISDSDFEPTGARVSEENSWKIYKSSSSRERERERAERVKKVLSNMQLKVFLVVSVLAALQLASAQECGVVVVAEDKLREEINKTIHTALEAEKENLQRGDSRIYPSSLWKQRRRDTRDQYKEEMSTIIHDSLEADREKCKQEITKAVQWAVENITDTVQQLLDPLLSDLAQHHLPGTTSDHPATSCQEVKNSNPSCLSGYYWIQTATQPSGTAILRL